MSEKQCDHNGKEKEEVELMYHRGDEARLIKCMSCHIRTDNVSASLSKLLSTKSSPIEGPTGLFVCFFLPPLPSLRRSLLCLPPSRQSFLFHFVHACTQMSGVLMLERFHDQAPRACHAPSCAF